MKTKNEKYSISQVLTYAGNDVIATSKTDIPVGTIMKIISSKTQPVGFRNKKFRVVFCEMVSDNAEWFTVNLKGI